METFFYRQCLLLLPFTPWLADPLRVKVVVDFRTQLTRANTLRRLWNVGGDFPIP